GGRWLYAMVSPDNVPSGWSLVEFLKIHPKSSFSTRNTFADENGNQKSAAFSLVRNSFEEGAETTTVYIEKKFDDLAALEMIVTMGFKEGMTAAMNNLDEYFRSRVGART
ncbi:MAG TPA: SRPBCC domain-containing protein, partial [Puia sp.]|nr:SRPBCC domain-containing protein [Puia sp.]